MTTNVSFGTAWFEDESRVVGDLTERSAAKRFALGRSIAVEIGSDRCARGYVVHAPATDYVLVGLLGWPTSPNDTARLHFQGVDDGGMRLVQVECKHDDRDPGRKRGGPAWMQGIYLFDQGRRATLDDMSGQAPLLVDLTSSALHDEVSLLRFRKPPFGDYDHLVRPDLVERCLLSRSAFARGRSNVCRP